MGSNVVCRAGFLRHAARLAASAAALLGLGAEASLAQEAPRRAAVSDPPAAGVVRTPLPAHQADGAPISQVFLDLLGGTGDPDRDRSLRAAIERIAEPLRAAVFSVPLAESAVAQLRSLAGVGEASYRTFPSERPGEVVLTITATLGAPAERKARGALRTGRWQDLPVIVENERSLLRFQLNGGLGIYSDHNPWFASPSTYTSRSPIAQDPPGAGTTSWSEAWVEYGMAGASRMGSLDAYAFGELTALTSASTGQDLFRSDTRTKTLFEKAYGGVLWASPGASRSARVSFGRQNWQIDEGFLFSRFAAGANAGPHPALYLNPRTTYERALIAEAKAGPFRIEYFDVDPAELESFDSGTRFQGLHASWVEKDGWDLGTTAYRVSRSNTRFTAPDGSIVPREGQRTWSLRAGHRAVAGIDGLSALAEYARQRHRSEAVSARAWYAQVGYTARQLRWRPSLTYRYASFSGDDPATPAREAFDAPLSSGLDHWVQGINFKKVVTNSNLDSHRLRLNLEPSERLTYTIDWFRLRADVPLAGGERAYGDELDFAVRWAISRRLYFLGVAGVAWPGEVIKAQTQGSARPWVTFQASIFWGF